jgi:hypothetical protein
VPGIIDLSRIAGRLGRALGRGRLSPSSGR